MSRPNPGKLAAFLVVVILLSVLPVVIRGGLYITNYEGDALHLADVVLRMAQGQRPHVDFMTPLGALAFWPIALAHKLGADLGHAFAFGQAGFALAAAGPVWWAARTRLSRRLAYGFAAVCLVLLTSLSHGQSGSMIAISMHYNRWAWVLAFVAVILVVLPPRRTKQPYIDGAVLAVVVAGLALLKVTYFVAFVPVLLLILLIKRSYPIMIAALIAGAVIAAVLVALLGPAWLIAYFGDLQTVMAGEVRNQPGLTFFDVVVSPAYLVGTLTAFAGMALLRRAGARTQGLSILLLIPAFLYVTWQNFGNDSIWLILLSILLFSLRPARRAATPPDKDPSVGIGLAAFAALILSVPMLQNHAAGAFRLLTLDAARYVPMVPGRAGLGDVYMPALPADLDRGRQNLTDPGMPYAELAEKVPDHAPVEFLGETLGTCKINTGIQGSLLTLAADLTADEDHVFVADLISSHWLFGGGKPLVGGAPWNYGTLSGIGNARFVMIPRCAIDPRARKAILERMDTEGPTLSMVRRTPRYLLYEVLD